MMQAKSECEGLSVDQTPLPPPGRLCSTTALQQPPPKPVACQETIMSIYQKIFSTTSKRFASSGLISKSTFSPERLLWAVPGTIITRARWSFLLLLLSRYKLILLFGTDSRTQYLCLFFVAGVAFTWFIFGALTDDIKQSVGLYWDPEADVNKVEMERANRLEARAALKPKKPSKDDDEDDEEEEEEEEEEEVTAETVAAAVAKVVEAAGDDDDEDDDDAVPPSEEDEEEEEEEEEPKPKKVKVDVDSLSPEGKWDFFASKMIEPGDDDDDDDVSGIGCTHLLPELIRDC
jgi:hypothetical protein